MLTVTLEEHIITITILTLKIVKITSRIYILCLYLPSVSRTLATYLPTSSLSSFTVYMVGNQQIYLLATFTFYQDQHILLDTQ